MKKRLSAAILLVFTLPLMPTYAEEVSQLSTSNAPSVTHDDGKRLHAKKRIKMKSEKSMNMSDPMDTGMAREGMKKGNMKEGAAKKEAELNNLMQQEEMRDGSSFAPK